nr:hypothetical protein [Bradyrhizobium aeschynomenes]
MAGLVPGIHVILSVLNDVDGRDKSGHDDVEIYERVTLIAKCDSPGRARWTARAATDYAIA